MRTSRLQSSHTPWRLLAVLAWLALCIEPSIQQQDPIKNFCRRWGHQAAVVDERLYVDGGLATYNGDSKHQNYSNTYLIYHDLSSVASSGMPQPHANLSKNSSIPSVNGGILWPDTVNKRIYLYGGEYYNEKPWTFNLYAYDILNNIWNSYGSSSSSISGLSYGAGLSISSRGEGYYYGGWMNNKTDPNWSGEDVASSNMLVYSMDSNKWTNSSGPDDVGRAEGVMVYVPVSDGGMVVYFGGVRGSNNGTWKGQPMDEIILYDVLSGKSYTQNATGDVPKMRRRFCAGVSWVDDQSSYNIYVYGGLGNAEGSSGFDDIYILSLPTFTWVKAYPANSNKTGDYPHHSLTCNIVNEAQMIVHGGFFPLTNDCDVSDQWGVHNVDLGQQNKDNALWALYEPTKTSYVVPTEVLSVVGGKSTGGATNTKPAKGWDHADLAALMTRKASAATRSATRDVGTSTPTAGSGSGGGSSSKLSGGAIGGIVVGAVAGVGLISTAVWFLFRRRRQNNRQSTIVPQNEPYQDQPPNPTSPAPGPWSPAPPTVASTTTPPPFYPSPVAGHAYHEQMAPVELPSEPKPVAAPARVPVFTEMPGDEPKFDADGNLITNHAASTQPNAETTPAPQELSSDTNHKP